MGLFLYNHYYDKKEALEVLRNMKYYNKRTLEPFEFTAVEGLGILGYMRVYEDKMHEDFLIDKCKIVIDILNKHGDEAIDAFQKLTSPDENNFLYPLKRMFERSGDEWFTEMIDELSIPMKKEEFYHYLDIYKSFKEEQSSQ